MIQFVILIVGIYVLYQLYLVLEKFINDSDFSLLTGNGEPVLTNTGGEENRMTPCEEHINSYSCDELNMIDNNEHLSGICGEEDIDTIIEKRLESYCSNDFVSVETCTEKIETMDFSVLTVSKGKDIQECRGIDDADIFIQRRIDEITIALTNDAADKADGDAGAGGGESGEQSGVTTGDDTTDDTTAASGQDSGTHVTIDTTNECYQCIVSSAQQNLDVKEHCLDGAHGFEGCMGPENESYKEFALEEIGYVQADKRDTLGGISRRFVKKKFINFSLL